MQYREKLAQLITDTGGKVVDDLFVVEPGCLVINRTQATLDSMDLWEDRNILHSNEYENIGEFNARLCYLSFKEDEVRDKKEKEKLLDQLVEIGHLSIFNDIHITFLIAGVSDEVLKEFTAHTEAKISRLTSSKTQAMDQTLYRIWGSKDEQAVQKVHISRFLELRDQYLDDINKLKRGSNQLVAKELQNIFNLGMKATAFTFNMTLKDYHKLFIGRMPESGNEHDIRYLCQKMCKILHNMYPKVIREVDYYMKTNNNKKYDLT